MRAAIKVSLRLRNGHRNTEVEQVHLPEAKKVAEKLAKATT